MKFERDYFIHYYDTGNNKRLSIANLMKYFEDIALLQSENVSLGLNYYEQNDIAWLLFKWDIRIKSLPSYKDTIKVITQPIGFKKYYAYRKFEVQNSDGETLVEADSIWLLVNTKVRRPIQIIEDMYKGYGISKEDDFIPEIDRIEESVKCDYEKEFVVSHNDIDMNDHVNNVRYIEWAIETLPVEIVQKKCLSRVKVIYKKETVYGKIIKSSTEVRENNDTCLCLSKISDENDLCVINTEWKV